MRNYFALQMDNGQIFEIVDKKEATEFLRKAKRGWCTTSQEVWDNEDESIVIQYTDGTEIHLFPYGNDRLDTIRLNNIAKLEYSNTHTTMIYNLDIYYDEEYDHYMTENYALNKHGVVHDTVYKKWSVTQ